MTPNRKTRKLGRVRWLTREADGAEMLHNDEALAHMRVDLCEQADVASTCEEVLVFSRTDFAAALDTMARAINPMAFHRYKDGDCLPRGEESSTAAKVNQVQEWRERSAMSDARKALSALGWQAPEESK